MFEEHCTIIVTNMCNSVTNRNTMSLLGMPLIVSPM